MRFYPYIKLLHVLLAIIAVGFNASYGIWLARAAKEPQHQSYALRTVKLLDDRIANPAYVLLLFTGLTMVAISPLSIRTFWIQAALGLWLILAILGAAGYTRTLRKQIELVDSGQGDSAEFQRAAKRGQTIGIILGVMVVVIVYLMVVKPTP